MRRRMSSLDIPETAKWEHVFGGRLRGSTVPPHGSSAEQSMPIPNCAADVAPGRGAAVVWRGGSAGLPRPHPFAEASEAPPHLTLTAIFRNDPSYRRFYRLWQDMNLGKLRYSVTISICRLRGPANCTSYGASCDSCMRC